MAKIRPSLLQTRAGLARRMARRRLFHRMMSRQQVNLKSLQWTGVENSIYRALHTCSLCPAKAACAGWLAGAEPSAQYVRFCPNSETIEALRIMTD
jgi:hypothetical protein